MSFNVGVEIGQLAFVALVLSLAYGLRRMGLRWPRPVQILPAYVVGGLGAFWMIERVSLR